jgi:hypothetical protein
MMNNKKDYSMYWLFGIILIVIMLMAVSYEFGYNKALCELTGDCEYFEPDYTDEHIYEY